MKRILLLVVASAALAVAGTASAKPASLSITIRHELHGCHSWALAGGPFKASLQLTATRGSSLVFTDGDVMPHTLYQVSGPHAAIAGANMHMMNATARVVLGKPGTYVFGTKAGEDYMKGVKTIGEDNVLRLRVVVK